MEKNENVMTELINGFNKRFNLTLKEKDNVLQISSEIKLIFILNYKIDIIIYIIDDINKYTIDIINEKKKELIKKDIFKNKKIFHYLVSLKNPNSDLKVQFNENNYYTFFDDVEVRLCTKIIDYYNISITNDKKYTFNEIIEGYENIMTDYKESPESKGASYLYHFFWLNDVFPFLSKDDSKYLNWEKNIIDCKLKPELSKYDKKKEDSGKTISSAYSYKDINGNIIFYPNLIELKNQSGIEDYIYERLKQTNILLLRYRYYEFLLFWNSKKITKPDCFKDIIIILKKIILETNNNKVNFNYINLSLMPYYQRIIEIYNKYTNVFNSQEIDEFKDYILGKLKELEKNNDYRYILDILEFISIYNKISNLLIGNYLYFYELLEKGIKYYQESNNNILEIAYLECYQSIIGIYKNKEDLDFNQLKAESFKNESLRKIKENNYLGAIHFIKLARDQYLSNEGKHKDNIKEIDKYLREWHKLQSKDMKKIETEYDTTEIKKQCDEYIEKLSRINKNDAIKTFFSDYNLVISEDSFYNSLKITENSLLSAIASRSLLDEERTVFSPQTEEENKELEEWMWYGNLIQIFLPSINYIFNNLLGKNIISIDDIINYILSSKNITENDKKYIIEGYKTYQNKFYSSSISLLTPLVERFFRYLKASTGDDLKYTKNKSYYNISLDEMIKESNIYGIPSNIIRFGRYFFSQERGGFNLRNFLSHGLVNYDVINNKGINEIVLWFICLCYFNLKTIE